MSHPPTPPLDPSFLTVRLFSRGLNSNIPRILFLAVSSPSTCTFSDHCDHRSLRSQMHCDHLRLGNQCQAHVFNPETHFPFFPNDAWRHVWRMVLSCLKILTQHFPGGSVVKNLPAKAGKCVKMLASQSCLAVCDSMDWSSPSSNVHGILQVGILEWVAIPFSRGSFWPRDGTCVSRPMQETQVQFLVWEDPTGLGVNKPMCHNCWAHSRARELPRLKAPCLGHVLCHQEKSAHHH